MGASATWRPTWPLQMERFFGHDNDQTGLRVSPLGGTLVASAWGGPSQVEGSNPFLT